MNTEINCDISWYANYGNMSHNDSYDSGFRRGVANCDFLFTYWKHYRVIILGSCVIMTWANPGFRRGVLTRPLWIRYWVYWESEIMIEKCMYIAPQYVHYYCSFITSVHIPLINVVFIEDSIVHHIQSIPLNCYTSKICNIFVIIHSHAWLLYIRSLTIINCFKQTISTFCG